jgi:hypothetical protein
MDALKQFYEEKETHTQQFAKLLADTKRQNDEYHPLTMDAFTEDWNESQFWVSLKPLNRHHDRLAPTVRLAVRVVFR